MAEEEIGKVTHFFDKIKVAIIKLDAGKLQAGDKIKIAGRGNEVFQEIKSMQIEHESVDSVKKEDEFGLKIDESVKEGDTVFKVE
ncbi:MAG: hypothetical protein ABIB61_02780 [Candidatus Shapirobacteria bacterium]